MVRIFLLMIVMVAGILHCEVRLPAVSGMWYPDQAESLRDMVQEYIARANPAPVDGSLVGLVSPHAGYVYSGQVAAYGYKLLDARQYETVILLGTSHRYLDDVVSVWAEGRYRTPLGDIPVDTKLAFRLLDAGCVFVPRIHRQEHSLEAQLPFLQVQLEDFKIVPVLTSTNDTAKLDRVAGAISAIISESKGNVLLVCSTDMSHYHDYDSAVSMDNHTLDLIRAGNWGRLGKEIENGSCELCGYSALYILSRVTDGLSAAPVVLKYANSGDAMGDTDSDRVVGYISIAFVTKDEKSNTGGDFMDGKQREYLLKLARQSIENKLNTGKTYSPDMPDDAALRIERAVFVTLTENGVLRGCIGHMHAHQPLYQAVAEMAESAAFSDPRFPQVRKDELDNIEIEISILSPMQQIDDWRKIRLGVDGVWVRKGYQSGVFLPQVATETGWDLETFLRNLCSHKAGLSPDAYKRDDVELFVYQVEKFRESDE